MAQLVPMKLKNADKYTVMEPEAVSTKKNALLKAVVKSTSVEMSTGIRKTRKCER